MCSSPHIFLSVCVLLLSVRAASAQGTFTVAFDGPPVQPPGTGKVVQYYGEEGVWFVPIPGSDGFTRMGGGILGYPDDGTAYVQSISGGSLMFGLDDRSSFDPVQVDLAEYSDVVRAATTRFTSWATGRMAQS